MPKKILVLLIGAGFSALVLALCLNPSFFPFHIAAAIGAYLYCLLCVALCIAYVAQKMQCIAGGIAACEIGLFFAAITLMTGSIWAHDAWGTFWIWEPRLLGMFLMTLFFAAWRLCIALLGSQVVANKQLLATLIVLGLPAMALTHWATPLFGGIHPQNVAQLNAPVLHMPTCLCTAIGFGALSIAAFSTRHKKLKTQYAMPSRAHASRETPKNR